MDNVIKIFIDQEEDVKTLNYYGFDKGHNRYSKIISVQFFIDKEVILSIPELYTISKFQISTSYDYTERYGEPPHESFNLSSILSSLIRTLNELDYSHKYVEGTKEECGILLSRFSPSSNYLDSCSTLEDDRWLANKIESLQKEADDLLLNETLSKLINLTISRVINPNKKLPVDFYGESIRRIINRRYTYEEGYRFDKGELNAFHQIGDSESLNQNDTMPNVILGPSPIEFAMLLGKYHAVTQFYYNSPNYNLKRYGPALIDSGFITQETIDNCESFAIIKAISTNNINLLMRCDHIKEIFFDISKYDSIYGFNYGLLMWFEDQLWIDYFRITRHIKYIVDEKIWFFDIFQKSSAEIRNYLEIMGITLSSFGISFSNDYKIKTKDNETEWEKSQREKKTGWRISINSLEDFKAFYENEQLELDNYNEHVYRAESSNKEFIVPAGSRISSCVLTYQEYLERDNEYFKNDYLRYDNIYKKLMSQKN